MQLNMIDDPFEAIVDVFSETALTFLFIVATLTLNATLDKFVQVSCALLVTDNVIASIALPLVAWITISGSILSYFILALLFIWNLLIVSYIFNKTLKIDKLASVVMGVLYFMVTYIGTFYISTLLNL